MYEYAVGETVTWITVKVMDDNLIIVDNQYEIERYFSENGFTISVTPGFKVYESWINTVKDYHVDLGFGAQVFIIGDTKSVIESWKDHLIEYVTDEINEEVIRITSLQSTIDKYRKDTSQW